MSQNKLLDGSMADPTRRLATKIKQFDRNIRELKTRQAVGLDAVAVQSIPTSSTAVSVAGPYVIPANNITYFHLLSTPSNQTLTLWNFAYSVFVDPVLSGGVPDAAHLFPDGSSLAGGQLKMNFYSWLDWADSSDSNNQRYVKFGIQNFDSSSHTYYLAFKAYLPSNTAGGV